LRAVQYADLGRPLQERRREIVAGTAPPTQAEIDAGEKVAREDDDEYEGLPAAAEGDEADVPAGVPDFWLTALQNHPTLIELVTDKDAAVLKHLTDITLHYLPADEGTGFRLRFHFAPNEWFENTTLEKTYVYSAELDYAGEFMYDKAIGSEIKWKSDEKDLTKVVEVKKQRNKSRSRARRVPICVLTARSRHEPHASCEEDAPGRLVLQLLQPAEAADGGGAGGHGPG
jgi:nucleosome assembly protein 1-like 1